MAYNHPEKWTEQHKNTFNKSVRCTIILLPGLAVKLILKYFFTDSTFEAAEKTLDFSLTCLFIFLTGKFTLCKFKLWQDKIITNY